MFFTAVVGEDGVVVRKVRVVIVLFSVSEMLGEVDGVDRLHFDSAPV
jgi:hypothetical protein